MKESLRYLQNAKEILAKTPVEGNSYTDVKPVREAFGTAYLAVLEAIKEALLKKGIIKKDMPKSIEGYRAALKKYLAIHNGKLFRDFETLYDELHIAGYYQGLIRDPNTAKGILKTAKYFIEKIP
ncbi:MAG: DUF5618 family protein [Planctomycetes bacterium]|nr:DUF5618 family protein [Planctomycetota bacterium]